ncbi:cytochrome d ubiquinol oxidase subunit II [Crossiella equi]|uniref:Cytochrome d ubiquinol oxidase subunit II n=1 Tax=Crossiella equi TaxID=130796 RepID=A0ABS5AGG5_9PSEU|nr:cytochrome d ubiquinol oxidase subunit II [Crossiella equi]MBP2475657.1 cytochrome d ubiquinol oxidase subunit II [Crossiella equi]
MDLATVWFVLIALLWFGYLFLEGFDFGVGMLLGVLGRTETERRVMVNTIGPVWDGNEVWMIVAVGATFAAFPSWYASLLSGAFLPVLAILLALIGRGVAFEYRGKVDSERWRRNWDRVIRIGSWVPPLGWGVVLTATVVGLPLNDRGDLVGGPIALLRWETLLGALAVAGFCLVHGAVFTALKTEGEIRARAGKLALRLGPVALLPLAGLLGFSLVGGLLVLLLGGLALWRLRLGREGQSFALLGALAAVAVATLFGSLYPDVLPSTMDSSFSLTVANASASPYTLTVMTWVAAFGTPAVLAYQAWTYWVFRQRIGTRHIPAVHAP